MLRLTEPCCGLDVRCDLLEAEAPAHAALLRGIADAECAVPALHAMWTGPEIACPIDAATLPFAVDVASFPIENATSHPAAGDIVLVIAERGRWGAEPRHDLIDIGLFYAPGARLLLPMGWIEGSVCARVVPEDLGALREACERIRRAGACTIRFAHA